MERWRSGAYGQGLQGHCQSRTILGYGTGIRSCALFRSAWREFLWYTEGINGFVDVTDTAKAIVRLLATDISGQRFILNGDNWSFRHLFTTIAREFGKTLSSV